MDLPEDKLMNWIITVLLSVAAGAGSVITVLAKKVNSINEHSIEELKQYLAQKELKQKKILEILELTGNRLTNAESKNEECEKERLELRVTCASLESRISYLEKNNKT